MTAAAVLIPSGQGLKQIGELGLAFALSSLIGLEREWRQKSAGLRTHTLVGFGAALFVLVSKYGFSDVVGHGVSLDPSRVAAQIVSGIGFIGGGLIFVRRDVVRGLTTAAVIWDTAAIGMACGGGLPILALVATGAHFVAVFGYRWVAQWMPRSGSIGFGLRIIYADGRGILRTILSKCNDAGFSIIETSTQQLERPVGGVPAVSVTLELRGQPSAQALSSALQDTEGILEVAVRDLAEPGD